LGALLAGRLLDVLDPLPAHCLRVPPQIRELHLAMLILGRHARVNRGTQLGVHNSPPRKNARRGPPRRAIRSSVFVGCSHPIIARNEWIARRSAPPPRCTPASRRSRARATAAPRRTASTSPSCATPASSAPPRQCPLARHIVQRLVIERIDLPGALPPDL